MQTQIILIIVAVFGIAGLVLMFACGFLRSLSTFMQELRQTVEEGRQLRASWRRGRKRVGEDSGHGRAE
ncbi:hypothetical protein G9272_33790 [Streptomyces asoensis]|uniref:Uncharacterized protein n=1 Tax=Streptomyces asoensis TaxID=249586 RepID=A0A6M4X939_9ACTN|nr:hypothetical protein [Streptomyces asoensis]QJT04663.1 hypothetical protein G9272_33790 [Streptomyces asoensis]